MAFILSSRPLPVTLLGLTGANRGDAGTYCSGSGRCWVFPSPMKGTWPSGCTSIKELFSPSDTSVLLLFGYGGVLGDALREPVESLTGTSCSCWMEGRSEVAVSMREEIRGTLVHILAALVSSRAGSSLPALFCLLDDGVSIATVAIQVLVSMCSHSH